MKSQNSTGQSVKLYRGFAGIDAAASEVNMETPDAQALVSLDNAWCSPYGYLSNERPITPVGDEQSAVSHVRFYAGRVRAVVYAARLAGRTNLRVLDRPGAAQPEWPADVSPASCVFNNKTIVVGGRALMPQAFDGTSWSELSSDDAKGAKFSCVVSNRLVLAGFDRNKTEIIVSRVDREDILASDEEPGESSVIKAFRINVANLLGTADEIKGVAAFETNKLAIFTNDRTIVYSAPADQTQWQLDPRVNVNVGTISHNTIAASGDEVFFCSRVGVHALRRSSLNGETVFTRPLSRRVERIYRRLVGMVRNKADISAMFDPDNGRYTVFFPVGAVCHRLSLDVSPRATEDSDSIGMWSLSSFAGLTCGDALAGNSVFGSASGLMTLGAEYDSGPRGAGAAVTPILWHGDILSIKQSHTLLLHASGNGRVVVRAESESGRDLGAVAFDIATEGEPRTDVAGVPLLEQFERPFSNSYTGLKLTIEIEDGNEQVRIFAVGIRQKEI